MLLLLIGESLTDALTPGSRVSVVRLSDLDDDICGVSLSVRFGTNLVSVWNRVAAQNLPISAQSGKFPFARSPVLEEQESSEKRGVEKMKEVILNGLQEELKPQSYFYRV